MGFNTVAVILNDALGFIEDDPEIGKGISDAVMMFSSVRSGRRQRHAAVIPARAASGGVHCNAMTIISQAHADYPQVVVVHQNSGWLVNDEGTPPDVLEAVARALRDKGYRVTKPKAALQEAKDTGK